MTAGRRDQSISLQRATITRNEYNEEIEAWEDIGAEWAAVFFGRGSERRQAAMEQGAQVATFQVLSNQLTRGLLLKDRIFWGAPWDVTAIALDTPERGTIELTAVRLVP